MRTILHGGEYWKLHDTGAIERPGLVTPDPSAWRVVGAVERNNFWRVVRRYSLEDILRGGIEWKHANGKQKTFVLDYDHGTIREWRSPGHRIF